MSEMGNRFCVKIDTGQPLDLLDLTTSFAAIAEEYRRYAGDESARLYVDRISEGSVVAWLMAAARETLGYAAPLIPLALDTFGPFLGHWNGLLTGLANYGRDQISDAKMQDTDKASLRNARSFVQPAINGNPINIQGDANITQINFSISAENAGDIVRAANHLLANPLPEERQFENEPLVLYQMRNARAGDLGYIDRFDKRPRRLTFDNEAVKQELIHQERPFDVFFFVSGYAKTAAGEIASYHIQRIDGVTEKDVA